MVGKKYPDIVKQAALDYGVRVPVVNVLYHKSDRGIGFYGMLESYVEAV